MASIAFMVTAPMARAGSYTVRVCNPPESSGGDGITQTDENSTGISYLPCGNTQFEAVSLLGQGTMKGARSWTLTAPGGTKISQLSAELNFAPDGEWRSGVEWELRSNVGEPLDSAKQGALPPNGQASFAPGSQSVTSRMFCPKAECTGGEPLVRVGALIAELEDLSPPTGALTPTGPIHGFADIPFSASDVGVGVFAVGLVVDGRPQAPRFDGNGGKCQLPYKLLVPCKLTLSGALGLDSTEFADGVHRVQLMVEDGAGAKTLSPEVPVTVHNAPANKVRPTLGGQAVLGGHLFVVPGEWVGEPSTFDFTEQWLRCPPGVAVGTDQGCTAIPAATQATYAPTAEDVGKRIVAKVRATNKVGSETALSVPSQPVTGGADLAAPLLKRISLSRAKFKSGQKTVLHLSSSEAGTLSISVAARAKPGHPVGTLTREIGAGASRIPFTGRLKKAGPLAAGRYLMTLRVRDGAGNVSKPARLSFTILPK